MFRGNGSRTYYGEGPLPSNPQILWRFGPMSGMSMTEGKMKLWTGTGWTGEPVVAEFGDDVRIKSDGGRDLRRRRRPPAPADFRRLELRRPFRRAEIGRFVVRNGGGRALVRGHWLSSKK